MIDRYGRWLNGTVTVSRTTAIIFLWLLVSPLLVWIDPGLNGLAIVAVIVSMAISWTWLRKNSTRREHLGR